MGWLDNTIGRGITKKKSPTKKDQSATRPEIVSPPTTPIAPAQVSVDAVELLTQEGIDAIIDFEVGGGRYYEDYLSGVCRPNTGESGITIGIGCDLGHLSKEEFEREWKEFLAPETFNKLMKVIGFKGWNAEDCQTGLSSVYIPFTTALAHFSKYTLPKWIYRSRRLWPKWDALLPLQRTALLSIAYNRGTSLTGTRREEMREIVEKLKEGNLQGIPLLIRNMSHWHTLNGLQIRRHKEAILFESPVQRST
jgi:hypothetical protein